MKLKCKKTINSLRKDIEFVIIENTLYEVDLIDSVGYVLNTEDGKIFFKKIETYIIDNYYVWDYFYTPQEERKIKIANLLKKED
jgi:hypothetical protein